MPDRKIDKQTNQPAKTSQPAPSQLVSRSTSPHEHGGLQQTLNNPRSASPQGVLALQGRAGNRAVQRLINSSVAIQRQAPMGAEGGEVESGLQSEINTARGGGRPLDAAAGSQIGGALGADFSHVRVHTDTKSDALNQSLSARAFTTGNDIFFSQGAYNPGTGSGKQLLAHELTHVVQQGGGKANKVQTKLTVGPASDVYEQEADRVSDFLFGSGGGIPALSTGQGQPQGRISRKQAVPGIQRTVKMYDNFDDARKASKKENITGSETQLTTSDLDTAFGRVVQALTNSGIDLAGGQKKKMKAKLKEWIKKDAIMAPSMAWFKRKMTGGTSLNTGRAQDKRFGSYLSLGQALMGHLASRQHKKTESKLAAKVKKSGYIKGKLREVQRAIYTAIEMITDDQLKSDVWKGMTGGKGARRGEYFHWYKNVKNIKNMMQQGTGDFKQAIANIHDVSTVMLNNQGFGANSANFAKGILKTHATNDDFMGTVEGEDGNTTRKQIKIGYRANSTTVNEDYDWVKTARAHGALLWAGPSHTTATMMFTLRSLSEKVPAIDVKHMEAVAWAIFGFWNKDFFTFKDGYHTFHEVMDVAKGYGVPYTPFTYPSEPPPAPVTQDVEDEQDTGETVPDVPDTTTVSTTEEPEPIGQKYKVNDDINAGSVPSEVDIPIGKGEKFTITDDKFPGGITDPATDWVKCFYNGRQVYIVAYDITNSTAPDVVN